MEHIDVRWRGEKVVEDKSHRLVTDTQIDTWNKKAEANHKHKKSDITDFPTSMPASDVKDWAKADKKPTYSWDEITNKPTTPATHTHVKSDIVDFPDAIKNPSSVTIMLNGGTTEDKNCFTYDGSKTKNINITPANIGASLASHLHDDRYYTKQDIDEKILDSAQGVFKNLTWGAIIDKPTEFNPTTHTHTKAEIKDFPASLKNPNNIVIKLNSGTTEAKDQFTYDGSSLKIIDITPSNIGASAVGHKHTKSDITDFPTSMPASDVYDWAKAKNKPTYSYSEILNPPTEFNPSSHSHKKSDITDFPESLKNPLEITIHLNGGKEEDVNHFTYDGSRKKSINITPEGIGASPSGHTHDDRYYTEYEIDTKLKNISDSLATHNHVKLQGVAATTAVPGKSEDGFLTYHYNVNNGLANNMPSTNNANAILTISRHGGDYTTQLGFSSNDNIYYRNGVGTTAWKRLLDSSNFNDYAPTKTGGGASGKWNINISGKADTAGTADKANAVDWGNVGGKPTTYPATSHTHTKSEITDFPDSLKNPNNIIIKLNGGTTEGTNMFTYNGSAAKTVNITPTGIGAATSGHNHDSVYSKLGHNHDERYYTETEIDTKLSNIDSTIGNHKHVKADITDFPTTMKNPTSAIIRLNGGTTEGSNQFSYDGSTAKTINITPAGIGAATSGHNHDSAYSKLGHTHDDRYYTETEIDTKLNGKANSTHNHTKSQITDFPESLKNPKPLIISVVGSADQPANTYAYDGSIQFEISVSPSNHNHDLKYANIDHSHTWDSITGQSKPIINRVKNAAGEYIITQIGDDCNIEGMLECGEEIYINSHFCLYGKDSERPDSSDINIKIPAKSGTMALLSDIPSSITGDYLPLSGGTVTGRITRSAGGAWVAQREYATVYQSYVDNSAAAPVAAVKTVNGAWAIGSLAGTDSLCFSYSTDTDYNAGNNSATVIYMPVKNGTVALTSDLPTWDSLKPAIAYFAGISMDGNGAYIYGENNSGNILFRYRASSGADYSYTNLASIVSMASGNHTHAYLPLSGGNLTGVLNTYSEYQSYKGTGNVDWRFGSATGTGDANWFGFYNYSTRITSLMTHTSGILRTAGEIQTTSSAIRIAYGTRGFVLQNDGANVTFNGTGANDQWGAAVTSKNAGMNLETGQWWFRDNCGRGGNPVLTSTEPTYRVVYFQKIGSQIRVDDTSGNAYYAALGTSDIRLKENVSDTEVGSALNIINKIKLHSFDWKETEKHQKIGFIADELEELDDNLAHGGGLTEEGGLNTKMVDSFYLQGYEIKAIQELSDKVSILEKENEELKNYCKKLLERLDALTK